MSKRVIVFLLSFVLFARGLESKKSSHPIKEIPELNRTPELCWGKKFINYFWKKFFTEPLFSEGPLGKLVLENWTLPVEGKPFSGYKGEELLRRNIFPFMDEKSLSELRPSCSYLNALVEDEWVNNLKNLSAEDVRKHLKGAVTFGYVPLVEALCQHEKLGESIKSFKDRFKHPFYSEFGNLSEQQINKEKEVIEAERSELSAIFVQAVKNGNRNIITHLLEHDAVRSAATWNFPFLIFDRFEILSMFANFTVKSFFQYRSYLRVCNVFTEKDCVMWMTASDEGYIEIFEMDLNPETVQHTYYDYKKRWEEKCKIRDSVDRNVIAMEPPYDPNFGWGQQSDMQDGVLVRTRDYCWTCALDGQRTLGMAVYCDIAQNKRLTYIGCKMYPREQFTYADLLSFLAEKDCAEAVKFILKRKDKFGLTHSDIQRALFFAAGSGSRSVCEYLSEQKTRAYLDVFASFLDELKQDTSVITMNDIVRVFVKTLDERKAEIVNLIYARCKGQLIAYAHRGTLFTYMLFKHALLDDREDVLQKLFNNKKSFEFLKKLFSTGQWQLNGHDERLSPFLMKHKDDFCLTAENTFYALVSAAHVGAHNIVNMFLENFNYSEQQLAHVINYSSYHEIKDLVRKKIK